MSDLFASIGFDDFCTEVALLDMIHCQTALIESTKAELQEIEHNQNVLHRQNQKLQEEVKALRAQLESPPAAALGQVLGSGRSRRR